MNVDHSEYQGLQDKMDGDADVLRSTHVFDMSLIPKEVPTPNKSLTAQNAPRLKMMAKRLVKWPYIYSSPFVDACTQQFNKIRHSGKLIVTMCLMKMKIKGIEDNIFY